jgi:hypothetical protein
MICYKLYLVDIMQLISITSLIIIIELLYISDVAIFDVENLLTHFQIF